MKHLKNSIVTFLFGILLVGLTTNGVAQNQQAAFKAYNKALELAKAGDYQQAINMFNQAIANAEQIGEQGTDIIERSQNQLPSIYYQLAIDKYKTFQQEKSLASLEETIAAFRETGDVAEEYNSTEIAGKADQVITQLLYNKSLLQFRTEDYDGALASLDQALERNPNYARAYYQKGLVIKNQDNSSLQDVLNLFDKAIETGQQTNNNQIVQQAQEAAYEALLYRGATQIQEKNYDEAVSLLEKALTYSSSGSDAYYRLAEAYNKQAMWDAAITNANKALEYANGGRTDMAKIYYELGTAYQNKGNKEQACSAFSDAAYGSFKAAAEHQMEFQLKCEGM